MKEFTTLRTRAREKRDKAIDRIRADYSETLVQISKLEHALLGRVISSTKKVSACIEYVIPTDRTFNTTDVMTSLEALDPGRVWKKASVNGHISVLREKGIVRRVKKSRNNSPAVYARIGVKVDPVPFEGQTLTQVVATVLSERKLNQTELVVAILEAGYETAMLPQTLRNAVGLILRKSGLFRTDAGKWFCVDK